MPIPELNEHGLLPPGIHECTLEEIGPRFGRFQRSDKRLRLFSSLARYVGEARATGLVEALIIDGSFVTDKAEPGDLDLIVELTSEFPSGQVLAPFRYNAVSQRYLSRYFGFDALCVPRDTAVYRDRLRFYQQVRNDVSLRKGILRISL